MNNFTQAMQNFWDKHNNSLTPFALAVTLMPTASSLNEYLVTAALLLFAVVNLAQENDN